MNDEEAKKVMDLIEEMFSDTSNSPPFLIKDGILYKLVNDQYIASEPENWIEEDWMRMWEKMHDE